MNIYKTTVRNVLKSNTKLVVVSVLLLFLGILADNITTYMVFQKNYDYAILHEYNPYIVEKVKENGLVSLYLFAFDVGEAFALLQILAIAGMISTFWFMPLLDDYERIDKWVIVACLGLQIFALVKISAGFMNILTFLTI